MKIFFAGVQSGKSGEIKISESDMKIYFAGEAEKREKRDSEARELEAMKVSLKHIGLYCRLFSFFTKKHDLFFLLKIREDEFKEENNEGKKRKSFKRFSAKNK